MFQFQVGVTGAWVRRWQLRVATSRVVAGYLVTEGFLEHMLNNPSFVTQTKISRLGLASEAFRRRCLQRTGPQGSGVAVRTCPASCVPRDDLKLDCCERLGADETCSSFWLSFLHNFAFPFAAEAAGAQAKRRTRTVCLQYV